MGSQEEPCQLSLVHGSLQLYLELPLPEATGPHKVTSLIPTSWAAGAVTTLLLQSRKLRTAQLARGTAGAIRLRSWNQNGLPGSLSSGQDLATFGYYSFL